MPSLMYACVSAISIQHSRLQVCKSDMSCTAIQRDAIRDRLLLCACAQLNPPRHGPEVLSMKR